MPENPPMSPQLILWAYQHGAFPMAEARDGEVAWYSPDPRAILPLDGLKVRRSLRKRIKAEPYLITFDQAFEQVIRQCAEPRPYADDTWINDEIIANYVSLHHFNMAHSVEAWTRDPDAPDKPAELVGGLYGVSMNAAFFGESMFSTATDASKICLVHLVEHLNRRGYTLLDVQMNSPHMEQFGVIEIPREQYLDLLAVSQTVDVTWAPGQLPGIDVDHFGNGLAE